MGWRDWRGGEDGHAPGGVWMEDRVDVEERGVVEGEGEGGGRKGDRVRMEWMLAWR